MNSVTRTAPEQDRLLDAAVAGDRSAFDALVTPHLRAIHVHCYRMLSSYHDAEEATQEALLRAWQPLATFEGRAPLRHWLYRIATTTCLKSLARRGRLPVTVADIADLEPYPDRLLDQLAAGQDPAAQAARRESVALAFVAALQLLPPGQRAALILRDVLAFSAVETADLLDISVAAANSALQRARAALPQTGAPRSAATRPLDDTDRRLAARFIEAWQRNDVRALAALLREDVVLRMPPEPVEFAGRATVAQFFATVPGDGRLDRIALRLTAANGQFALAAYEHTADDRSAVAYGLMVLTFVDGGVAAITGFRDAALFDVFALPQVLSVTPSQPGS